MIGNPTEGLKPEPPAGAVRARVGRMIGNPTEGLKPVIADRRAIDQEAE